VEHSQVVLVLTDRLEQAALLRKHLLDEGFQVEVIGVEENPDWISLAQKLAPGAVILDMPVASRGLEWLEMLKSNQETQDVPVIFYSLLQEQSNGSMLVLDYLIKPFAGLQLEQALERLGFSYHAVENAYTVLVVDDNPDILEIHVRLVANHLKDCRVLRAANGLDALDQMRRNRPNLVLLDLMMPELDGAGVLDAMHEDERLRDIPVIVVTAQTLTEEQMARLNQGVASVLAKGIFTVQETLAHIDQALAQTRRVGSDTQRLVRKVMAFIHEHYAEPISRETLSSYARVSERHLNRCFLQETGLTPVVYLNRYRIEQAKHLLRERSGSITEVMGAVGFSDSSYFAHVFRREVGVSPSEYQRGKK
jgi:YesN/AraC family two-component response regulator